MRNHRRHFSSDAMAGAANAVVAPRWWILGFFLLATTKQNDKFNESHLCPLQERRLQRFKERLLVPFDETRPDHQEDFLKQHCFKENFQEAMRALWNCAFPNVSLRGMISEQWKYMGWQGSNPSTDFRGCGFISVENLLFHARTYPTSLRVLPAQTSSKFLEEDEEEFDVLYCVAFEMIDANWLVMNASYLNFNEVLQATREQLERSISRMHSQNTRPSS